MEENHEVEHVSGVLRANDCTLDRVLHHHVIVVVAVAHLLQIPATCVLELLGDGPPVERVFHPAKRWHAVCSIRFEEIEERRKSKSACSQYLPESHPFKQTRIFINDLTLGEAKSRIRVQAWGLNEWLELITRMSRSALETEDTIDRFLSEDRVAQSGSNVGELLVLTPLDLILSALIVIVMRGGWAVL